MIERLTKRMDKVLQHFGLAGDDIHELEPNSPIPEIPKPSLRERDTKVDPNEVAIAATKISVTAPPESDDDSESEPENPTAEANIPGTVDSPTRGNQRKTVTERKTITRMGTGNMGGAAGGAVLEIAKQ